MQEPLRLRDVPSLLGDEFSFKRMRIDNYDSEHEFFMCHWQRRGRKEVDFAYLLYRGLMAFTTLFLCLYSMSDPKSNGQPFSFKLKWFIYISSWSFMLITAQCIVGFAIIVRAYFEQRKSQKCYQPILNKIYWVLSGVNCDMAPVISIIYWIDVYDPLNDPIDLSNISLHYLNCVIVYVELLLACVSTRLLHCYWTVGCAVVYMMFSLLFEICEGSNWKDAPFIYEMTAWKRGYIFALFSCIGLILFTFIVRFICFIVQILKRFLYDACYRDSVILPTSILQ